LWLSLPCGICPQDNHKKCVSLAKATACATSRHSRPRQNKWQIGVNSLIINHLTNMNVVQDSSQSSMAKEAEGSVGTDLSQLARAASHAQPYPQVDSQGQILSADALKLRGMHAAQYHKTSIEAMLHSTHAGATPYRTVLGDVCLHSCIHPCLSMSVCCLFLYPSICPCVHLSVSPSVCPSVRPSIYPSIHSCPLLVYIVQLHAPALLSPCGLPHASSQYISPHESRACMTHNSHRQ